MPTPFYHLRVAEVLFEHPDLKVAACERISQCFPAFLLGNIAPDVQVISGQSREATHFYRLPMRENCAPAWEQMLSDQPALKPAGLRDGEQGVFISGYLCHLQADWFWVEQIFDFFPEQNLHDFWENLITNNIALLNDLLTSAT